MSRHPLRPTFPINLPSLPTLPLVQAASPTPRCTPAAPCCLCAACTVRRQAGWGWVGVWAASSSLQAAARGTCEEHDERGISCPHAQCCNVPQK